jgi:hypothetical protein
MAYRNRARMTYSSTGTGTLSLNAAVAQWQTFAASGIVNGEAVTYLITEGTAWEIGNGVYSSAGPTLTRVLTESSTGSLLSLLGGGDVAIIADANTFRGIEGDRWYFGS